MIILKVLGGYVVKKRIVGLSFILLILMFTRPVYCEELSLSGSSYILMDASSGRVLLEKNSQNQMPMASLTKIMTALVAIEKGDFEKPIKIDRDCTNIEGSSIYLRENEVLSLEDLLYGLMLRSGNDAAIAIAKNVGGSLEVFNDMMNEKAKELGLKNTSFRNPHGLSTKDHFSTAYDLAIITKEALKHNLFKTIFLAKTYSADRDINNYFINKNKTLWEYQGGDGGKIGYTMEAGRCLVSTASKNQMQLIAVSLNARNWFDDNYQLFDYGFENFKSYLVYNKNQCVYKAKLEKADRELHVVTEEDLIYPLGTGEIDKVKNHYYFNRNLKLPIEAGEHVGYLESYLNGKLIKKTKLKSRSYVHKEKLFKILFKKLDHKV